MENLNKLASEFIEISEQVKELQKKLKSVQSAIEAIANEEMENRNVRSMLIQTSDGTVRVSDKYAINLLNLEELNEVIGNTNAKEMVETKAKTETSIVTTKKGKILKAIVAYKIYNGQKPSSTIEEIVSQLTADDKKRKVLNKKLVGQFEQKAIAKILTNALDVSELDVQEEVYEIYLNCMVQLSETFLKHDDKISLSRAFSATCSLNTEIIKGGDDVDSDEE